MLLISPCIEGITGKFGTIVRKNFFRPTMEQHGFIQVSCYLLSGNRCIHFQGNTFPRNLIDQSEYAEPSASDSTITDKVHWPAVIRAQKVASVRRSTFCINLSLKFSLKSKAGLFVEAINLFMINMDAFSLKHHIDTTVSKPFPARCYRLHGLRNLFLFGIVPGLVTLRAARYPYQPASSAFADVKVLLDSFAFCAFRCRRYEFFEITSFRILLSSERSATSSLSFAFSASSCFSLLISETFISPYFRFQL